jgi:DNA (cytosine-5)-methyltransferase 1
VPTGQSPKPQTLKIHPTINYTNTLLHAGGSRLKRWAVAGFGGPTCVSAVADVDLEKGYSLVARDVVSRPAVILAGAELPAEPGWTLNPHGLRARVLLPTDHTVGALNPQDVGLRQGFYDATEQASRAPGRGGGENMGVASHQEPGLPRTPDQSRPAGRTKFDHERDNTARQPTWLPMLTKEEIVERIDELLEVTYRSGDLGNVPDVLSETVYILLSLNTREAVYQRVYRALRSRYPRWVDLASAPTHELATVLQPGGLQEQRAHYLKKLLQTVRDDNLARGVGPGSGQAADLTLEYLRPLSDEDVEQFLLGLPGVGKKTARCVMAYALDRQQFAVDTHVERIFSRLGLARSAGTKTDHDTFQAVVPPTLRKRLHINLVHHGRAICENPQPKCRECVLVSFCGEGQARGSTGDERPTAIDLFAGAGGLGYGFRHAGWRVALAVERDRHAAQTYRVNNPGTPVIEADVTALSPGGIRDLCPGLGEPDAVLAGPPCQGYSAAGSRDPDDPKNLLFAHVVRLADGLRAHLVVLENVPGLRRVNGVGFIDRILEALRKNHTADRYELVAADFGVPQNRRRLFFFARRKDLGPAPTPPKPTHSLHADSELPRTPRLDAVLRGDLELPAGTLAEPLFLDDGSVIPNASTMLHSRAVIEKIAAIEPGKGPISYRRLEADTARTLVAGHRALPVHPWLDRTISVREAARIQGFPDSYVFCGPRANQPLQVANAVPPPVARAVAEHLRSFVDRPQH